MQYHDLKLNRAHIATYADRLLAAEAPGPGLPGVE
jgi:hypothetical protein